MPDREQTYDLRATAHNIKDAALKKWNYIVKNKGSDEGLLEKYPELNSLISNCSFCEAFNCHTIEAHRCQLNGCCIGLYEHWLMYNDVETAKAIRDMIKAITITSLKKQLKEMDTNRFQCIHQSLLVKSYKIH